MGRYAAEFRRFRTGNLDGLWRTRRTPSTTTAEYWLLRPRADVRVAAVYGPDELRDLLARYPRRDLAPDVLDQFRSFRSFLDFERLSRHVDGLWIPSPWAHRFDAQLDLGIWFSTIDAESTLWFRWAFEGDPERLT